MECIKCFYEANYKDIVYNLPVFPEESWGFFLSCFLGIFPAFQNWPTRSLVFHRDHTCAFGTAVQYDYFDFSQCQNKKIWVSSARLIQNRVNKTFSGRLYITYKIRINTNVIEYAEIASRPTVGNILEHLQKRYNHWSYTKYIYKYFGKYVPTAETELEGGMDVGDACTPFFFLQSLAFFTINLKNYKLCLMKLD